MIRLARPDEAAAVRELVHAAYRHYIPRIGKPPGPMMDDYAARIRAEQTWVLEDDGRIAGILVLEPQAHALLLDNIAVAPDGQGKGFGRRLMSFTEQEARRRGLDAIILYTHVLMTENIALYRRAGYVETGRVNEKGFERVYMRKDLPTGAPA
ncbi:MAG: GNAT family N-acetyltransferase [Rhodospirillales bacterium 69-11]|nr:GNAT family N-acetyltransferase [Rhodospirillales bacterium]OJW28166.1 MAG: GNAT family N-acetyltransferase [Rhodospirillales bacterium 69-11]